MFRMLKVIRWSRRRKFTEATENSTRLAGATGDGEVMSDHTEGRRYPSPLPLLARFLTWPLLATTGVSVADTGSFLSVLTQLFPRALLRVQAERKGGTKQNWSDEKRIFPRRAQCFCMGRIGACYLQTWGRTKKLSSWEHVQVSRQLLLPCRFSRFFTIYLLVRLLITTKE